MKSLVRDFEKRFWFRVRLRGDCWEWRGTLDRKGYGIVNDGYENLRAHRVAFEYARGPIPPSLIIHHLCEHQWCVRPSHLILTTNTDNVLRGNGHTARNARKKCCIRGHRLPDGWNRNKPNGRRCLTCRHLYDNARYWRRKAQLLARLEPRAAAGERRATRNAEGALTVELDFSKCRTPEDVERVFAASRERLAMIRAKMAKLAEELEEPDAKA